MHRFFYIRQRGKGQGLIIGRILAIPGGVVVRGGVGGLLSEGFWRLRVLYCGGLEEGVAYFRNFTVFV